MKKIKELQKRSSLSEGRNYGIGFAILKPVNSTNTKFETLNAFTACRDYLNDFSYVEYTKQTIGSIHGYNHKVLNVFDNKRLFYLGVNTLHRNYGGTWNKKEEALNILVSNYKVLEKLLNKFEQNIGIVSRSKITLDEDTLIIKAPIYWTKTTALISAYTLIIRCYFNVSNFTNENFEQVLKEHKPFITDDSMYIKNCVKFYENPKLKYDQINYDNYNIKGAYTIHNFGITGYFNLTDIKNKINDGQTVS